MCLVPAACPIQWASSVTAHREMSSQGLLEARLPSSSKHTCRPGKAWARSPSEPRPTCPAPACAARGVPVLEPSLGEGPTRATRNKTDVQIAPRGANAEPWPPQRYVLACRLAWTFMPKHMSKVQELTSLSPAPAPKSLAQESRPDRRVAGSHSAAIILSI